jgi:hypothetical protein
MTRLTGREGARVAATLVGGTVCYLGMIAALLERVAAAAGYGL